MISNGTSSRRTVAERLLPIIWRTPPKTIAEQTRRRVVLHLIPFLFFLYILAYLDRVNISVGQLGMGERSLPTSITTMIGALASPSGPAPLLAVPTFLSGRSEVFSNQGLDFGKDVIGFGAGIFFWGYLILEIPSSVSVTRWGARWVFARILVLWGICAALVGAIGTPFANSFFAWLPHLSETWLFGAARFVNGLHDTPHYQFYFFRFLLGFFEGGFFPSVIVYLSLWFRGEDRAKAIAAFMSAIPLSSMLGMPISGLLLDVNWWGIPGWRWIFILEGILPVLAGFAALFLLPDGPAKSRWLPDDERAWLTAELEREQQERKAQGHAAWVHHLGLVLLLTVVYFCQNLTSYGLSMFMPDIIKSQTGTSNRVASLLASLPYVMGLIVMLTNGWHSDRTGERVWHVALPLILLSLSILLAGLLTGMPLLPAVAMILLVGSFMYAHLPAFWPIPTMFLGATAAASATGFINMIGNLGGYVGPKMVGATANEQLDYRLALLKLAPWSFLGGVIVLGVGYVRRRIPVKAPSGLSSNPATVAAGPPG